MGHCILMIALLLTAALLSEPSPKLDIGAKPAGRVPPAIALPQTAPVLAGVAVTVECTARPDGRVTACQVLEETHPDLGFGEAAVALMTGSDTTPSAHPHAFTHTIQFTP